jgi:hypothetical protein
MARRSPHRLLAGTTALFVGAVGLVALFLADDAFLQPEPGTSAGDRVVSGLVPIAILVVAAAGYGWLRQGGRGALALLLGVITVAAGLAVSVRHAVASGPSGDDYLGLVATAAGLLLAGLGIGVLWRSRRAGECRRRRYLRRSLLAVAGVFVALWFVQGTVLGFYATHSVRTAPAANPDLGRSYQQVSFRTKDGLKLVGWYVPSRNRAAVIVFPGRHSTVTAARMLAIHGYGVLLFDRRGEGASEGDSNALGWGGDRDLLAAIRYLQQRPDVNSARIGGLGLSVGGELMIETAAKTVALKAVVSEGAGARSIHEYFDMPTDTAWLVPGGMWLLTPMMATATTATAVFSTSAPPPSLDDLVGRIAPRPLFLITAGPGNSEELNRSYYASAGEPKTLWEIPEAGHIGGIKARPAEYERRVVSFFDHALLPAPSSATREES